MQTSTLGFALAAGLVAALNPCGFAMLPSYLTLVVLGSGEQRSRSVAAVRAVLATAAMAVGFLAVFAAFGLIIAPLASQVRRYLPIVTIVIGAGLVALGVWMLSGREITVLLPKPRRGAPTSGLPSMFGYGLAYALASLSCTIGPFFAVTASTFRTGSMLQGVLAYLAYATGMTIVVGILAGGIALAGPGVAGRARELLPYVNRIGGGLVLLVGLYIGYYGIYETRLFFGTGDASDPVINAALSVQQTLAGWIEAIGPIPLAVGLAVLIAVAVGGHRLRQARRPRGR